MNRSPRQRRGEAGRLDQAVARAAGSGISCSTIRRPPRPPHLPFKMRIYTPHTSAADGHDYFHDALDTLQDLANSMVDPFDLGSQVGWCDLK